MNARRRIIPVFIPHLGCPHSCVFCNQSEITGTTAQKALEELQRLCNEEHPNDELAFYGGSFTALPREEMLRYLEVARGRFASIRLSTRPDAISCEILELLKAYHVTVIELGAQSMRDEVLCCSGRGHTVKEVEDASRIVKKSGLKLVLQMMTGLPGDDDSGAVTTAKRIIAQRPDAVRIYPTVIVRGTELERLWRAGQYREHTVEDAVRVCSAILPLFEEAEIPVIRIGLNPTEELSYGAALAGAYHPALGELVRSRMMRNLVEEKLSMENNEGKRLTIRVPKGKMSQMIGQKRCNIEWLSERFRSESITVEEDKSLSDSGVIIKSL